MAVRVPIILASPAANQLAVYSTSANALVNSSTTLSDLTSAIAGLDGALADRLDVTLGGIVQGTLTVYDGLSVNGPITLNAANGSLGAYSGIFSSLTLGGVPVATKVMKKSSAAAETVVAIEHHNNTNQAFAFYLDANQYITATLRDNSNNVRFRFAAFDGSCINNQGYLSGYGGLTIGGVDSFPNFGLKVYVSGTTLAGAAWFQGGLLHSAISGMPTAVQIGGGNAIASGQCYTYVKSGKWVFAYRDNATMRYTTIDLVTGAVANSTTAP